MSRPLILLTAVLLLPMLMSPTGSSSKAMNADSAVTTWTIMVYMADDTTSHLPWQDDMNEMEAAHQIVGTNIIALVDEYGDGNTTLRRVQQDPNGLDPTIVSTIVNDGGVVIPLSKEVNTASPATLSAFVNYSVSTYPAQRYVLILWGHGANWHGLCPDGSDLLLLPELRSALASSISALGRPLDMVIIDSCAEASLEMLRQIKEYAKIFVSSEKGVPFQGLPYTMVMDDLALDTNQAPEVFGARIVDAYVDWSMGNSPYSATMGVYNLSRLGKVLDDLAALSDQGRKYDGIFHGTINAAFASSEHYEDEWSVDFGSLMDQLQRMDLPLEMRALAIESSISYQHMVSYFREWSNPDPYDGIKTGNATGAIIYAPGTSFADSTYVELELASTSWYDFGRLARHIGPTNESLPGPTMTYKILNQSVSGLPEELDLDWSYDYSLVTVWVFRREPGGMTLLQKQSKSDKSPIVIDDVFGSLVLATSAERAGEAVSYLTLNATLYGKVTMNIVLIKDGRVVNDRYDVRATVGNKSVDVHNGEEIWVETVVPSDLDIGQMVRVEVLRSSNGDVVGTGWLVVTTNEPTSQMTEIQVFDNPQNKTEDLVLLCFSILPGILILIFALLLLLERGKDTSKKN